jgi:hypothetical protein
MAYTTIDKPDEYFDTLTWTGDNATRNITDLNFQPDWVWIKHRSFAFDHREFDSVRGASKSLATNKTSAEASPTDELTAFLSNGFTLGNSVTVNGTGYGSGNFVGWSWKANGAGVSNTAGDIASTVSANTTSGFSIVSWTGTGVSASVGHGLGVTPNIIFKKNLGAVTNWVVSTTIIDGSNDFFYLNATNAKGDSGETAPTSTLINLFANDENNGNGNGMIAYCFAEKQGYSKFGSYTGNGSTDGTFVYTGFKPAFVMIKGTTLASSWAMFDTVRSTINPVPITGGFLLANVSNAEAGTGDSAAYIDILSNGFKIRNNSGFDNNSGSDTYIYMCFAENPFVTSTSVPTTAR